MAEAETKAITPPRYITLAQAAERIGREELEFALVEGRLSAWDRTNWAHFEELAHFLRDFALRGAAEADLDAVLAISRGAAIPAKSWRRWFASGSINWETNEIVRMFADRVLIYQPVLLNADVLAPFPEREAPPAAVSASETPTSTSAASKSQPNADRDAAIKKRLDDGERPGSTVTWDRSCDVIRDDCGGWKGDPKRREARRGYADRTIKRIAAELML